MTPIELRPKEGYLLTQSANVPDTRRVFTNRVILGRFAKPEDWKEVPIAEAQAFEDTHAVVLTDRGGNPIV